MKGRSLMKTKLAVVGVGSRGFGMFIKPLVKEYSDAVEIVALCDRNPLRAQVTNKRLELNLPIYTSFDEMLTNEEIDKVLVTTQDSSHHEFVIKSLKYGKDVICEKPLTIDAEKCQEILDTEELTGKR